MQLEKYERRERNQVGETTVKSRMSALRDLKDFIGGDEPEVEDVENWVDHLIERHEQGEVKASTISQYYKAARYYFTKVKNEPDALDHIVNWLPEKDVDHGAYMDEEEWERLRRSVHNIRDRAFLEVMYHYARRPSEVLLLNEEDVDLEEGTIQFNILKKEKDDRGEKLPWLELKDENGEVYQKHRVFKATFELLPEVEGRIRKLINFGETREQDVVYSGEEKVVHPLFSANGPRMKYSTAWDMIKRRVERADIDKNITPKSWRHSRATHLNWSGHSPEQIADKQLIHDADTDVVGAYVHSREEDDVREVMSTDDKEEKGEGEV